MREKKKLIKRDRDGEERSIYVGNELFCSACGRSIVYVFMGIRWRDIDNAYLGHVRECFSLRKLIAMEWKEQRQLASQQQMTNWLNTPKKRLMASPKNTTGGHVMKRDLIKCPQCSMEQLALVIEKDEELILAHECRLCKHEFTTEEFVKGVIIQDFDNRNTL